ncbi:MAG: hypothetical protein Hens3KO_14800 [Henriciella sp.]
MKPGQLLVMLFVAGAIAAVISFNIAPRLNPPSTQTASQTQVLPETKPVVTETRRSARIGLRDDGHYWARALVNRKSSIEFMVDTGASVVALTFEDAQKMGLKPETLDYRWAIRTAGGETMGASVLIDSIKINQIHIRNVEAMVLRTDMDQSLLGMSFLSKLYSYEFRGDWLIIRQ